MKKLCLAWKRLTHSLPTKLKTLFLLSSEVHVLSFSSILILTCMQLVWTQIWIQIVWHRDLGVGGEHDSITTTM